MKKTLTVLLCVLMCVCLLLGACAAAPQNTSADSAPQATSVPADTKAEIAAGAQDVEAAAEEAGTGDLGNLTNAALPETNRKLTYSASFDISTKQYDSDYNIINVELGAVGGYIEYESSTADVSYLSLIHISRPPIRARPRTHRISNRPLRTAGILPAVRPLPCNRIPDIHTLPFLYTSQ